MGHVIYLCMGCASLCGLSNRCTKFISSARLEARWQRCHHLEVWEDRCLLLGMHRPRTYP